MGSARCFHLSTFTFDSSRDLDGKLGEFAKSGVARVADLHRAGRDDRMSDDVLTRTGQKPLSAQECVRTHAATVAASAKEA